MIAGGSGGFHSNLLKDLVQVDLVGFDVLHDPKNTEKERESGMSRVDASPAGMFR